MTPEQLHQSEHDVRSMENQRNVKGTGNAIPESKKEAGKVPKEGCVMKLAAKTSMKGSVKGWEDVRNQT